MSVDFAIAPINMALKNTAAVKNIATDNDGVGPGGVDSPGVGFSDTLSGAATSFVDTLNKAEATSIAGLNGDASAYEVASSVMEAERSLRMTIAVRDKIVAAYLEITRMQI